MTKSKIGILLAVAIIFLGASSVMAAGSVPRVGIDPEGDLAVRFEVGETWGDASWIWMPFASPIDVAAHPIISVSFDIYRYDYGPSDSRTQNLYWGWVDEEDSMGNVDMEPSWGAQWDLDRNTYPFGWFEHPDCAPTVFGRYATIELMWDFEEMVAVSWYDGEVVNNGVPITDPEELLYGWDITLFHSSDTGRGPDVIWIDNFVITGSDIYNANGFENFALGDLNGQDGWVAGTEQGDTIIPEPCTLTLLGLGLAGALVRRRRNRR